MRLQIGHATHIFVGLMGVSEILIIVVSRGTARISLLMGTTMMRRLHGQPFNKQYSKARVYQSD
jgi:hypothetical protein